MYCRLHSTAYALDRDMSKWMLLAPIATADNIHLSRRQQGFTVSFNALGRCHRVTRKPQAGEHLHTTQTRLKHKPDLFGCHYRHDMDILENERSYTSKTCRLFTINGLL